MSGVDVLRPRGILRVQSLKDAGATADGGILFIRNFEIQSGYHHCTSIAVEAIRSLLRRTTLWGKWSLAVYLANATIHFNETDWQMEKSLHELSSNSEQSVDMEKYSN